MDELQKYELEAFVEELGSYHGKHTELITVLIPAGASLVQMKKQLEDEKGTANNIKSSTTRKNVINALDLAVRKLKEIGRTPKNGLAVFSGLITTTDGRESLEVWAIEPPKILNVRTYRCDQRFLLDPLIDMLESDEVYGLLIIELNEASIGILDGNSIKLLKHIYSGVPGQHKTGGQCLSTDTLVMKDNGEIIPINEVDELSTIIGYNFDSGKMENTKVVSKWKNKKELFEITTYHPKINIRASLDHTFFVVADNIIHERLLSEIKENDYLVIPNSIYNDNIYPSNIIPVKISKIESVGISDTIDIETDTHNFIANGLIVHNSAQRFERVRDSTAKEFYKKTAEHMKRLFWDNKKLKGIFIGGPTPTKDKFLKQSQLVTQLRNKVIALKDMGGDGMKGLEELVKLCKSDLEEQEITKQRIIIDLFMERLGKDPNKVSYGEAEVEDRLRKGAVEKLILSKSLPKEKVKLFMELAESSSSEVHLVTDETPEGVQFRNLGGFGGLLRFEIYD